MTKKTSFFIISILFLLVTACSKTTNKSNTRIFTEFPKIVDLKSTPIDGISDNIYPQSISLLNNRVILCDYASDPHFYVYELPNFDFISSFGKQGKGTSDIHDPVTWSQFRNNKLGLYQINLMKFGFYDVDSLLISDKVISESNYDYMPPEINDAVNIVSPNADIYIGTGINAQGEFFEYNKKTKKLIWRPFVKDFDDDFEKRIRDVDFISEYKTGIIKIKPDATAIVKTYMYAPFINIFDIKGNLILKLQKDNFTKPLIDFNNQRIKGESNVYYTNTYLTNDRIYAVYRNCSVDEYINDLCNDVQIHVFDWSGKVLIRYNLNEGIAPLSPFVVSEKYNEIYSVNPKSENSYYSRFKLEK